MNRYPVQVRARLDAPSRGLWLVKWLLLIPHYIVLVFLWLAFVVLTLVAYIAVLVTGRYPQAIFEFNVGVLRWTWRVGYYGYEALGTDRYPPFTLAEVPDYPAGLHIDSPPDRKRWLPLVAWLLAVPHLLIIGVVNNGGNWQLNQSRSGEVSAAATFSLVTLVVLIAAVALLFTGRYPRGLYDLLVGIARWTLRVVAYVALLTEVYPPFRLDQGEHEPDGDPRDPTGAGTDGTYAVQRAEPFPMPPTTTATSSGG
jgi:hypothetical protein